MKGIMVNKYVFADLITFNHCWVHSSLLSKVTPRYFVCVLNGTLLSSMSSWLGNLLGFRLLFVNIITSVFEGLNFSPTLLRLNDVLINNSNDFYHYKSYIQV